MAISSPVILRGAFAIFSGIYFSRKRVFLRVDLGLSDFSRGFSFAFSNFSK